MNHTFIFFKKDKFEDFEKNVICPLCGELSDNVDIDDYTEINMVMWCKKHCEILLCITPDDFDKLYEGIECGCTTLSDKNSVIDFYKSHDYKMPDIINNYLNGDYYIYKCHMLKINKIISSGDKVFDDINNDDDNDDFWDKMKEDPRNLDTYYHDVDIISFSETEYNTYHGGIDLYYNGYCLGCNKRYESYIWGD